MGVFLIPASSNSSSAMLVHVASLSADVCLVCFNPARKLADKSVLHGEPDSVKHEPSGLLRDTERTVKFVRADSVLRIHNHPCRGKPLVQSQGGIFEDRSHLCAKLLLAALAIPHPPSF